MKMSEMPRFDCAPGIRLQAHEKLTEVHLRNFERRMERLEEVIVRLEKRLWITVYGVVAIILAEGVQGILAVTP